VKLEKLKNKIYKLDLNQYNGMPLRMGNVLNAKKFVQNHISFLEANSGNVTYICYYNRLLEFYEKTKQWIAEKH
jgi:hypothetical protein